MNPDPLVHGAWRRRLLPALLLPLLAARPAGASTLQTFGSGSLIIPEQATYQTGCGAIAAYGLVWRLLQENGPGGAFNQSPLTIYLAINTGKQSPNRCVPSNRHLPPQPNNGTWNDSNWNDGCDLTLTNTGGVPVVPVDYAAAFPKSGLYPVATVPTYTTDALPAYRATTLNGTVSNPPFQTIQYLGGPYVIDAQDAQRVINLIKSDANYAPFRDTSCSCPAFAQPNPCRYVQLHQATIQFSAPIGRRINQVPPRIALLNAGGGVSAGILDQYLDNAGLNFPGAGGCPPGTTCALASGGTVRTPGLIYDQLHAVSDLMTTPQDGYGVLNRHDPVTQQELYRIFWAPHWQASLSKKFSGGREVAAKPADITSAMNNIAYFANQMGHGLLAECASLESYEGSWDARWDGNSNSWQYNQDFISYTAATQFMYTNGISINGLSHDSASWDARNCTDPDYLANPKGMCVVYPNPAEVFSQLGDFHFAGTGGFVQQYWPHQPNNSRYQPGVKRLAVSWENYTANAYDSTRYSFQLNNGWDFITLGQKDNDAHKATLLYLAGHTYTGTVPGNRIVLNTLMNLGAAPNFYSRSVTAPTAYVDTVTTPGSPFGVMLSSTYKVLQGDVPPGTVTADFGSAPSLWMFPYNRGDVQANAVVGTGLSSTGATVNPLGQAESDFNDSSLLWSADVNMPPPRKRNLFTYFGGRITSNPYGTAKSPRNGVLQTGWRPESIQYQRVNANFSAPYSSAASPNPGCVDELAYGTFSEKGATRFGLVPGHDGICDLQQALQYTPLHPDSRFNLPSSDVTAMKNAVPAVQELIQRVRGFCYSTSTRLDNNGTWNPEPDPNANECNPTFNSDGRAHLGAVVHSTAALVTPSPYIQDQGAPRPTVAYVTAYDGQLHAIYVSGGAGYQGPVNGLDNVNPDASSAFAHDYLKSGDFAQASALPRRGTELWSYLPSTQLPFLLNNTAQLDSSPVVQDVFVDMTGTGLRQWHTVLVVSVGPMARELFAFDITNPLRPVLLWDLVGSNYQPAGSSPPFPSALLANDSALAPVAYKWHEPTAHFAQAPLADGGRETVGVYDYGDLGASKGLSLSQLREGQEPVYAVFAATNSPQTPTAPPMGLEVFAIDVANGQKLWQWEEPYLDALANPWTRKADNAVPPVASLRTTKDGVSAVYVGDMEGRIWELDANTGINLNAVAAPGCPGVCKYALYDTQGDPNAPQPISTNLALALTPSQSSSGPFSSYAGKPVLLFGTAGEDFVQTSVAGTLNALKLDPDARLPLQTGPNSTAQQGGVATQIQSFPYAGFTAPQRMYGYITVAGQTAFIPTSMGTLNDPFQVNDSLAGATYQLDLGGTGQPVQLPHQNLANFGGVTVLHWYVPGQTTSQDIVVGTEVSKLTRYVLTNPGNGQPPGPTGPLGAASASNAFDPSGNRGISWKLMNWTRRFLSQQ